MFFRATAKVPARLLSRSSSSNKQALSNNSNAGAKNIALALALVGFVGTVYYTAISKMKGTDDLGDIIAQERKEKK